MERIYSAVQPYDSSKLFLNQANGNFAKAIKLMNRHFLDVIQDYDLKLAQARVFKRDYSYYKGIKLTEAEAKMAIRLHIRVDAITTEATLPKKYGNVYQKERIKDADKFYAEHDVQYDNCLYLSPDYRMAKLSYDNIVTALRYFVAKNTALIENNMSEQPILYMMMGMPGSGKSTLAAKLNAKVFSADAIRFSLIGSIEGKVEHGMEFVLCRMQAKNALVAGVNAVYDATLLNASARGIIFRTMNDVSHKTVGCFFNCSREEADARNWNPDRDKNVPAEAMERLWNTIQIPTIEEGFDEIYDIIVDPLDPEVPKEYLMNCFN